MPSPQSAAAAQPSLRQLLAYPFRIFFLSVAVLAVAVIPLWVAVLTTPLQLPLALPNDVWHQHELVFAFLYAGAAGFLLTAVCVWTGTERLQGRLLLALWLVWALGRGLMLLGGGLPAWLVAGVNLAFLPLVALDAGWRVWRARQSRHIAIFAVLGVLWLMQLGLYLDPAGPYVDAALIAAAALMLIVGGRITPTFSRNWLLRHGLPAEGIRSVPALESGMLAALAALLLAVLADSAAAIAVTGALAGGAALARIALWQGWRVRAEPLLWILHLSLLWVPAGLLLLAGSGVGWWPDTVWVHALGVGAMGGLMLGVMSRVALAHTGRPLVLPAGMVTAFGLIQVAALVRVATGLGLLSWHAGVAGAGVLWVAAYAVFLLRYAPVLAQPRADGKAG